MAKRKRAEEPVMGRNTRSGLSLTVKDTQFAQAQALSSKPERKKAKKSAPANTGDDKQLRSAKKDRIEEPTAIKQESPEAEELPFKDAAVEPGPNYKDETNAFNTPVEDGRDYISGIPAEVLQDIMSYLIRDHDPERAVKSEIRWKGPDGTNRTAENPHVLKSLAAMSCHFRDQVEAFSLHELISHKTDYSFRTNAELEQGKEIRRSERLQTKPKKDHRRYRHELVTHLHIHCIRCNSLSLRRGSMVNGVACCQRCDYIEFPNQISLTDALQKHDLRDWMLIPTRKPGPRAKQLDLPTITYGTVRIGKPFYNGTCMSYRFFCKDVEKIAKLVHEDVDKHMLEKTKQRRDRKLKRAKQELGKLRVEHHERMLANPELDDPSDWYDPVDPYHEWAPPDTSPFHRSRIDHYKNPDRNEADDSDVDENYSYDPYSEEHRRICTAEDCEYCFEGKMRKYVPWWS